MPQYESIWADGVPAKINKEDILTPENILSMCIRFTIEQTLKDKGYEVVGINGKVTELPNIVIKKEDKMYALVVVPCIYPNYMRQNDNLRIDFVNGCIKQNLTPVICPVLIHSTDKERALKSVMLKGDTFKISSLGQEILTNEPKQELALNTLKFKF